MKADYTRYSWTQLKKELIRVNITIEIDEDDLLGGYRLKDGQTVWIRMDSYRGLWKRCYSFT